MIKVSDFIAKRLKEHGVENFFMVSGGGAMHLNDSLGRNIPYIANHHEQACAMAAEGYARVNQRLAVVNVTTGPGGLNCLNGVFGQWTDSVPVLYISGQVKFSTTLASCPDISLRQLGDQEVDIISVVSPLTKYAKMVVEPKEIKYHLDKAVYEATTGRFGPVWLDIPMNVQAALVDENDLIEFVPEQQEISDFKFELSLIFDKLSQAKRPVIVGGHGVRLSGCVDLFRKITDKLKIPVLATFNGFDIIENQKPYYIGRIGTIGQRAGNFALQNADFILFLGTRNNIRQVSYNWENFAKNAFKVVVDIDDAELQKPSVIPDIKVCADLNYFLPAFDSKCVGHKFEIDDWLSFCQNLKDKFSDENFKEHSHDGEIIDPYLFVSRISEAMDSDDVMVIANGSACVCSFQSAVVKGNQRYILNSGNASMGFDLPAAIGAFLEKNGKNLICLSGDGSIMMNLQELQTIVHNKMPIKIFIINNHGYSSIMQTQKSFFNGVLVGSEKSSGVSVPDFVKVAQAFGLKSVRISQASEINRRIKEILESKEPVLCDVLVKTDYSFAPKLTAKCLEDGTMVSPSIEDMHPFLGKDEFCQNML